MRTFNRRNPEYLVGSIFLGSIVVLLFIGGIVSAVHHH